VCSKYDTSLWRSFSTGLDELSITELRASLGKQIVSELPEDVKAKNQGRYIAVTFSRKVLAICDNMYSLNLELAKKAPKENYYIARIGHRTIAQI
jgi:hypothetical protein